MYQMHKVFSFCIQMRPFFIWIHLLAFSFHTTFAKLMGMTPLTQFFPSTLINHFFTFYERATSPHWHYCSGSMYWFCGVGTAAVSALTKNHGRFSFTVIGKPTLMA